MKVLLKPPRLCTPHETDSFYRLVRHGGQVHVAGLRDRILAARLLALALHGQHIVGVAALKLPSGRYRDRVFAKAGVADLAYDFALEMGWVYTKKVFRGQGIARQLLQQLLSAASAENLFATTRDSNESMCHLLSALGLERAGSQFGGGPDTAPKVLWLRSATNHG